MRKALNENPVVQVVMIGVLGVVGALVFMMQSGGGAEPEPAPDAAAAIPGGVPVDAAAAGVPGAPATTAPAVDPTAAGAVPAVTPAGAEGKFEASAGLPKEFVNAHERGDVVVLLVQQNRGIEDKKLRKEVDSLRNRSDTSVFVVDAKRVADYSRIAEGVSLDRIPAIVVVHPKDKGKDAGGLPVASVRYGFRGQASVEQAVRDALYDGKQLPYHPG